MELLPLEGLERLFDGRHDYEAFNTSGGSGRCATRWPAACGHVELQDDPLSGTSRPDGLFDAGTAAHDHRDLLKNILETAVPITPAGPGADFLHGERPERWPADPGHGRPQDLPQRKSRPALERDSDDDRRRAMRGGRLAFRRPICPRADSCVRSRCRWMSFWPTVSASVISAIHENWRRCRPREDRMVFALTGLGYSFRGQSAIAARTLTCHPPMPC